MRKLSLLVFLLFVHSIGWAQLTITNLSPSNAYNVVANDFLDPANNPIFPGTLQNVTFTSGVPGNFASFTGTSNLGFTDGIILSTGRAIDIDQPNTAFMSDPTPCSPPASCYDPQLQALSTLPIEETAVLQFDFQPLTDTIRFKYVFGSEEYPEYQCTPFNDVFGFFITGPNPAGGNYVNQNFALVPGTSTVVSIGTVNHGNGPGCPAVNPNYHVINTGTTIVFDGFTTVLDVVIPVKICAKYHLKLAVANVSDGAFDSGVFLKKGSFTGSFSYQIQANGGHNSTPTSTTICPGDTVSLCSPPGAAYSWSTGATTQCVVTTQPGSYLGLITNSPADLPCISSSGIPYVVIQNTPDTTVSVNGPLTLCAGDSVQLTANAFSNSYLWTNGSTTQSIWVNAPGSYNCNFLDTGGCGNVNTQTINVYSSSGR